ncbi:HemK [Buchnera aphidicola str. Bp (Baizongia pistaciae)]|uniref:Release factor glutamine methyltransferase n=1 Tax=Buchnera aphidicola subsp. Baizongia pistaciae (strain Bp) TaxID=224915 RepID=PRMC_BUCBP|nr:peptide chain release factor N(5)-glutamine methyltransferase [Buchnera aphidicola]Q89AT0.1 RecName: Full=Release factor glutamine methyltransferase; Short=RF MTase; AltName: Full=N5-glutamine methyltransferase PrmC; AltName: Full=Protein-(glutamine-N5) MTase PrmC; AltName: Full=Protein-glutamine N-methyltransferase PrmC [Buchnera aphidicola str. Bp (Baizongia pistaciae)]AAO26895.1 HemK [Buchnera aphidicola str. Bp (Baizongia pistaciae)]
MKIKNWLKYASLKLKKTSSSPNLDAEILLSYVLKKCRTWIISNDFIKLTYDNLIDLNVLLQRRMNSEPISYLIHVKEFWSLPFLVSNSTLIPRPDTEILVEKALIYLKNLSNAKVLDLGTGCGSIALALASERLDCKIIGIDCVKESISIASKNAKILKLKNVSFLHSIWFSKVDNMFDMIVSNPPYLSFSEMKNVDKEVLFEPFIALFSSENGLGAIRHIIKYSKKYLYSKAWLLVEHGWKQKDKVQSFFYKYSFININTYRDYCDSDRVTVGQKQ